LRELRNRVARWLALGDLDDASSSPSSAASPEAAAEATSGVSGDFMDGVVRSGAALVIGRERVAREYERRYIEHVLERFGGNVTHAAEASGIARRHFNRLRAKGKR
jgi:DNA-binding NtrC family response regulator